ncbi:hypothetical protein BESB_064430 [Besnoitia besnoiti]|uniref:Transmembrane protein n=1 Tax=Besnoitia besnoiti TaxID=94643 RepID=A0A2A9MGA3_BESBE|nr:hypothetical protein BESB_064430 [Besnoitia besnoiti]PFH34412.1 hypothetical protein BESB_064430 [Besnoitia besnoiti]
MPDSGGPAVVWVTPAPPWLLALASFLFFLLAVCSFSQCRKKRGSVSSLSGQDSLSLSSSSSSFSLTSSSPSPLRRSGSRDTPSGPRVPASSPHPYYSSREGGRVRKYLNIFSCADSERATASYAQLFVFDGASMRTKILSLVTVASLLRSVLLFCQVLPIDNVILSLARPGRDPVTEGAVSGAVAEFPGERPNVFPHALAQAGGGASFTELAPRDKHSLEGLAGLRDTSPLRAETGPGQLKHAGVLNVSPNEDAPYEPHAATQNHGAARDSERDKLRGGHEGRRNLLAHGRPPQDAPSAESVESRYPCRDRPCRQKARRQFDGGKEERAPGGDSAPDEETGERGSRDREESDGEQHTAGVTGMSSAEKAEHEHAGPPYSVSFAASAPAAGGLGLSVSPTPSFLSPASTPVVGAPAAEPHASSREASAFASPAGLAASVVAPPPVMSQARDYRRPPSAAPGGPRGAGASGGPPPPAGFCFKPHPLWTRTVIRSLPPMLCISVYGLLVLFLIDLYNAGSLDGNATLWWVVSSYVSLFLVWLLFFALAAMALERNTRVEARIFARCSAILLGISFTLLAAAWSFFGRRVLRQLRARESSLCTSSPLVLLRPLPGEALSQSFAYYCPARGFPELPAPPHYSFGAPGAATRDAYAVYRPPVLPPSLYAPDETQHRGAPLAYGGFDYVRAPDFPLGFPLESSYQCAACSAADQERAAGRGDRKGWLPAFVSRFLRLGRGADGDSAEGEAGGSPQTALARSSPALEPSASSTVAAWRFFPPKAQSNMGPAWHRLRRLTRLCPPLLLVRGLYLLLVGTQVLPHYYPSGRPASFFARQKESFDVALYLLTEFVPLTLLVCAFAANESKPRRRKDQDQDEDQAFSGSEGEDAGEGAENA